MRSGSRSGPGKVRQWRMGTGRVIGGWDWGGAGRYSRMQGGSAGAGSRRAFALGCRFGPGSASPSGLVQRVVMKVRQWRVCAAGAPSFRAEEQCRNG